MHIPALRERKEDILPLAQRFLEQYNQQYLRTLTGFSADAEQRLLNYPWYGNIRELQHTIEKAVILSDGNLLKAENLQLTEVSGQDAPATHEESKEDTPLQTLDEMEKNLVKKAIEQCDGNLSQAAAQLGITRQTLYNKMKNLVKKAIEQCDGNLSQAAAQLGITRQTLYNKMKRHGI